MKEAIRVTPFEVVTNTCELKEKFFKYHKILTENIHNRNHFESLIPEIVTPNFISLYGDSKQGQAVNDIIRYVEALIPKVEQTKMTVAVDASGMVIKDEKGKPCEIPVLDENKQPVKEEVSEFNLSKSAYEKVQRLVNGSFGALSVYWDARRFVSENIDTIDEPMFDKMNDYLWRNIMAVYYPEDIKREFKHLCICVKRKLFYLGDRNEVFNQLSFGLYDLGGIGGGGGTGKTTLLEGFAHAFSDGNPAKAESFTEIFDFNLKTADKYGVIFLDENAPAKGEVKDKVKAFVDSDTRKVEGKGIESTTVNNLLTLVISANHKISSRLYEDEARGQRRDAFFEVIGNLIQYHPKDMAKWFKKMFSCCPIEDDSMTYRHYNPHSNELTDAESSVLVRLNKTISEQVPYKLHQLAEELGIKSTDKPMWYALRSLLGLRQFFEVTVDKDKSRYYTPKLSEISLKVGSATKKFVNWWSQEWRCEQPFIDVDSVIAQLEKDNSYDCSLPIVYHPTTKNKEVE